jgi:uncharacterized protein YukE
MSAGGFPERPKGSPGGIEAAAANLLNAAEAIESAGSQLKRTASGLSGMTWAGQAEARFTNCAGGLATVAVTAEDALREAAHATRAYAKALETAQRIIDDARADYDAAKSAEATAGGAVAMLSRLQSGASPDEMASLGDRLTQAENAQSTAASNAEAARRRAQRARDDFDHAQAHATAAFEGRAPATSPGLGGPAAGIPGGASMLGVAGGTGGLGSFGGGFGVPRGGLGNLSGFVGFDQLEQLDGMAHSAWLDRHGQTEVGDLTFAIVTIATFGGSGILAGAGRAALAGGRAALASGGRSIVVGGRGAAARIFAGIRGISANPEARAKALEDIGDGLGKVGVPHGGDAGKIASLLSREEFRDVSKAYILQARLASEARLAELQHVARGEYASLRAALELSRGVRRGLPPEAIKAMERAAGVGP